MLNGFADTLRTFVVTYSGTLSARRSGRRSKNSLVLRVHLGRLEIQSDGIQCGPKFLCTVRALEILQLQNRYLRE